MGMDAILSVILPVLFLILTLEFSAKSRRRLKETMKPEDADAGNETDARDLSFDDLFRNPRFPGPPLSAPRSRDEGFEVLRRPEPGATPAPKPLSRKTPAPEEPKHGSVPPVSPFFEPEPPERATLVFSDDPLIQGIIFSEILKIPPGLNNRL